MADVKFVSTTAHISVKVVVDRAEYAAVDSWSDVKWQAELFSPDGPNALIIDMSPPDGPAVVVDKIVKGDVPDEAGGGDGPVAVFPNLRFNQDTNPPDPAPATPRSLTGALSSWRISATYDGERLFADQELTLDAAILGTTLGDAANIAEGDTVNMVWLRGPTQAGTSQNELVKEALIQSAAAETLAQQAKTESADALAQSRQNFSWTTLDDGDTLTIGRWHRIDAAEPTLYLPAADPGARAAIWNADDATDVTVATVADPNTPLAQIQPGQIALFSYDNTWTSVLIPALAAINESVAFAASTATAALDATTTFGQSVKIYDTQTLTAGRTHFFIDPAFGSGEVFLPPLAEGGQVTVINADVGTLTVTPQQGGVPDLLAVSPNVSTQFVDSVELAPGQAMSFWAKLEDFVADNWVAALITPEGRQAYNDVHSDNQELAPNRRHQIDDPSVTEVGLPTRITNTWVEVANNTEATVEVAASGSDVFALTTDLATTLTAGTKVSLKPGDSAVFTATGTRWVADVKSITQISGLSLKRPGFPHLVDSDQGASDAINAAFADGSIVEGDIIETAGYHEGADAGGAIYRLVASATGTDDGGSFVDFTGFQLQAIFGREVMASTFGANPAALDNSSNIQAAIDYAETIAATVIFDDMYDCQDHIYLHGPVSFEGASQTDGLNLTSVLPNQRYWICCGSKAYGATNANGLINKWTGSVQNMTVKGRVPYTADWAETLIRSFNLFSYEDVKFDNVTFDFTDIDDCAMGAVGRYNHASFVNGTSVRSGLTITNCSAKMYPKVISSEAFGVDVADDILITNNDIYGFGDDPIGLHRCTDFLVGHNRIKTVDGRILVQSGRDGSIIGNELKRIPAGANSIVSGGALIMVENHLTDTSADASADLLIAANDLTHADVISATYGIRIRGARRTTIGLNHIGNCGSFGYGVTWEGQQMAVGWSDPEGVESGEVAKIRDLKIFANNAPGAAVEGPLGVEIESAVDWIVPPPLVVTTDADTTVKTTQTLNAVDQLKIENIPIGKYKVDGLFLYQGAGASTTASDFRAYVTKTGTWANVAIVGEAPVSSDSTPNSGETYRHVMAGAGVLNMASGAFSSPMFTTVKGRAEVTADGASLTMQWACWGAASDGVQLLEGSYFKLTPET